ncbi:MAG TPA: hypothetical protein VK051_01975 [Paenalcaligenes sp.]|nr:hypothetical protein [Paenalcaligenes sp.]
MPRFPFIYAAVGVLFLTLTACAGGNSTASERDAARNSGSNVEVYGVIDAGVGHTRISK